MSPNDCSGRTLAFLGDAVWSLIVRSWLIEEGKNKGNKLQSLSIGYVSARAQASFYESLHACGFLSEAEEAVFRRARNATSGSVPHNTDAQTYRLSTGFEAVIGALYMEKNESRIAEIWEKVRSLKEADS